jgi:DNA polymerase III delta prime subunit
MQPELIDYARPTLMAEKALKEMHWAMLDNDFDRALEFALAAMAETKMAYHAIQIQKERADEQAKKVIRS